MKHGEGVFEWVDKTRYIGHWLNNAIEGYGEYYWPDGRSYKGQWKENRLHG